MKGADRVAAVGVGYSKTGRRSGLTSWQLAIQAAKAALADAGMTPQDLDGVALLWGVAGPAPANLADTRAPAHELLSKSGGIVSSVPLGERHRVVERSNPTPPRRRQAKPTSPP